MIRMDDGSRLSDEKFQSVFDAGAELEWGIF